MAAEKDKKDKTSKKDKKAKKLKDSKKKGGKKGKGKKGKGKKSRGGDLPDHDRVLGIRFPGFGLRLEHTVSTLSDKLDWVRARIEQAVPPSEREDPAPEIAGPALEAMRFLPRGHVLLEMLVQLLIKASSRQWQGAIHGTVPLIIGQLCPDEAQILRSLADGAPMTRSTAGYIRSDGIYRVQCVDARDTALERSDALSLCLEHLSALHCIELVTGSPPGYSVRNSDGNLVGHVVKHDVRLTRLGQELCELAFGARSSERPLEPAILAAMPDDSQQPVH